MPVHRIQEFDVWRPGYALSVVEVFIANTTDQALLFTDEALTVAALNPQTLLEYTDTDNVRHGKFAVPLYTSSPYYLDIDSNDQTGIERPPLTDIAGEDASESLVTATSGSEAATLADILDRVVYATDHGALGASASTNNATLSAAIGVAAASGGGRVMIPSGSYPFTALTLATGVVLQGEGRDATVIQCQTQGDCITISGNHAGLAELTLDGIDLQASSVGVFSKANDETIFNHVIIKRFITGMHFKGGRRSEWDDLSIDNCTTAAKLHGDIDAGGGSDGDEYRNNSWDRGLISNCTGIGLDLSYEDRQVIHNAFAGMSFEDNTGTAVRINGARYSHFDDVGWLANTTALAVLDDTLATVDDNSVVGLHIQGGGITGGAVTLNDTCQDVIFDKLEISDVDFTLTSVLNNILFMDVIEDGLVTISGDGTKFTRWRNIRKGESFGQTTTAAATKAWSTVLDPGQVAMLEAKVVAIQRDGISQAAYHHTAKVNRPGSTLDYDDQLVNFTVGEIVTGAITGATALITADADGGATGTLTLREISGEFDNDEQITDPLGGDALANGTLSHQNIVLNVEDVIGTDEEDIVGWDIEFVANITEIELQVTGAADTIIDWLSHVEIVTVG